MVDFGDMSRQKVFNDTHWLAYLLCGGEGIGPMTPLVLSDVKELCLHTQSGTDDFVGAQGVCHNVSSCICVSNHFAIPPAKDSPTCAICNKKFGDKKRGSGSVMKGEVFNSETFFDKPFWCVYCFCTGYAVHMPNATGKFIASQFKEFCCAGSTVLESPITDGIFFSMLGTFLCCWQECQMPPALGNPKVACCTWKLNKDHSQAPSNPPGAPEQVQVK